MHPLYDYIAKQLAERVKERRVVVWYDPRREFAPFVAELRAACPAAADPAPVSLGGGTVLFAEYTGSMYGLRAAVEPHVSGDDPAAIALYLPGCEHDLRGSVLMELEKGGTTWKPQLNQLARNALLRTFTPGVVDDLLRSDRDVTYEDLARVAAGNGAESPSILKTIFRDARTNDDLLAAWIASDAHDAKITRKDATSELKKLVRSRLGLDLPTGAAPSKLRAITRRYVLAGEFRLDLAPSCVPPPSLASTPEPRSQHAAAVRDCARRLRRDFAAAYEELADGVEQELGLRDARIDAAALGSIDTFRFEERLLLQHAGELVANARFDEALALVAEREHSFWLDRDFARKAHWEGLRRMAELGSAADRVRAEVKKVNGAPAAWLAAYTAKDGWYRLDRAQRRLEALVASLAEDPDERPLGIVRRAYEDVCHAMAEGFTKALAKAGWTIAGALHQTHAFADVVAARPKPVAFFLVDAMRYEMGVELAERLPKSSEVVVKPAVGALPSITAIGMAALLPGAAASFSVVEQGRKLGVRIDDAFLPDLPSRKRHAAARVPQLVDLTLDELLTASSTRLARKVDGAQVVIVRSQEIDHVGEGGFTSHARQVMDTVIDNLARALRKLAAAGIEHAVVAADHGHLFASDRDESMRIEPPGGDTVDLHRRCWIGRGGSTPGGCVRVPAASLGFQSDLDFVFPIGTGVFRAGGDLAFHHGGPSLQEMIVPVVTVRTRISIPMEIQSEAFTLEEYPSAITNRIFTVKVTYGGRQRVIGASSARVRPLLVGSGRQVGTVGMVSDGHVEKDTGCVTFEPSKPLTIAFLLNDDAVKSIRIVLLDPESDAQLQRSAELPVRLGISS